LLEHAGVGALGELGGELSAGLRVVEQGVDIVEVDLGDPLLERSEPPLPHDLVWFHGEEGHFFGTTDVKLASVRAAVKHASILHLLVSAV